MFGKTDGILGLAYAPLDDAFQMPADTWKNKYSADQVRTGKQGDLIPYLTQLAGQNIVSDKISFYTRRSFVQVGSGDANDPMNKGWMVVGGGEESTDLYTGTFQTVKVLSDAWCSAPISEMKLSSATHPPSPPASTDPRACPPTPSSTAAPTASTSAAR